MAVRRLVSLNKSTPQLISPQTSAGDTVDCPVTLNAATGNEIAYDLQYTVNKATSGSDTGLLINQTDTASPGISLLLDLQVGGVSKASIDNTGVLSTGTLQAASGGTVYFNASQGNFVQLHPAVPFAWGTISGTSNRDLFLRREAAGILSQRNGANAQKSHIYKTWIDASNYERLSLTGAGGITVETAGTGTANINLTLTPAGTGDVAIAAGVKISADRTTEDAAFINFKATADADAVSAISTLTTSGATTGHVQVEINGAKAWIAVSTNNPT